MEPLRFAFGVHLHQPTGNFDHVIEQHVRDAYAPFLRVAADGGLLPMSLHVSGPLLEWLEAHDTAYLELVGRLVADGRLELLLAGFYEPVLAALPRDDRLEQIAWLREALRRRFGADADGLWLTERVWEPGLAADLADAGVRYVVVDDRHFLVTGFERDRLHAPFHTESSGRRLALLPIDERLRYLIPFKAPEDTVAHLRALREVGHRLAVFADDGEKFGGWPGTSDWVFRRGWLAQFVAAIGALRDAGEVRLVTLGTAVRETPSAGLAYLPTASYREMEHWALPPAAATRLARLEEELGETRMAGPEGALLRGGHWLNFLVRYPEANRMHKKMLALTALCRQRGDPPAARRAIGRAQCNDAYWHGVFGGLYLPHLRAAIWRQLATAERELRSGEALAVETLDLDGDGYDELWIHGPAVSAVISPRRGGAIEELTLLDAGVNVIDVLTRRREAYHEGPVIVALDDEDRALGVARVLPAGLTMHDYERGGYRAARSWATVPLQAAATVSPAAVEIVLRDPAAITGLLETRLRVTASGAVRMTYRWDPAVFPPDAWFAPELSVSRVPALRCAPEAEVWSYTIATTAKSERGLEETGQGTALTPRWAIGLGRGECELTWPDLHPGLPSGSPTV
jgi:alpha-amylase